MYIIASQEKTPSMNKKKELRGSWGDVFLDVSVDWCIKKSSALWEDRQVTDIKFASSDRCQKHVFLVSAVSLYSLFIGVFKIWCHRFLTQKKSQL